MASPRTSERSALALALLFCCAPVAAQVSLTPTGEPLERIVAVVNDDVVLSSELDAQVEEVRQQIRDRGGQLPSERLLKRQVLERLIFKDLQLQVAANMGIQIADDELDAAIAEIAGRNHLTLEQLSTRVEERGQSYARYREDLRQEIAMDHVRTREVERRVVVTPREVDQYLAANPASDDTEYDVSHVLIALRAQATPDEIQKNQERADATYVHIAEKGNDFAAVATESLKRHVINRAPGRPRKMK